MKGLFTTLGSNTIILDLVVSYLDNTSLLKLARTKKRTRHSSETVALRLYGHLTELSLSNRHLDCIGPQIGQLTQLTELHLSSNKLTSIPPELGQLAQLTHLSLSNNQLTCIPPELGQLTQLTYLYLSNNFLTIDDVPLSLRTNSLNLGNCIC